MNYGGKKLQEYIFLVMDGDLERERQGVTKINNCANLLPTNTLKKIICMCDFLLNNL